MVIDLWGCAPDWANYLAQDQDGEWWWYENAPDIGMTMWNTAKGAKARAGEYETHWKQSLQSRNPNY